MNRFIIETDNITNTNHFLRLMDELKYVKSVTPISTQKDDEMLTSSEELYNWTNPTRPATEEEFKQMVEECEVEYKTGQYLTLEEAKKKTLKEIKECKKLKSK